MIHEDTLKIERRDEFSIPEGLILFISGVPGTGKTALSYKLLLSDSNFRIIEETDIIREILIGYGSRIESGLDIRNLGDIQEFNIIRGGIPFTLDLAKQQCRNMGDSLRNIVYRQQRKKISTIINGVHIIPSILSTINGIMDADVLFINLHIDSKQTLLSRLTRRDAKLTTDLSEHIDLLFQTNLDLYDETSYLEKYNKNIFRNVNVTNLGENQSVEEILKILKEKYD